jgi:hypothetical protein
MTWQALSTSPCGTAEEPERRHPPEAVVAAQLEYLRTSNVAAVRRFASPSNMASSVPLEMFARQGGIENERSTSFYILLSASTRPAFESTGKQNRVRLFVEARVWMNAGMRVRWPSRTESVRLYQPSP